MNELITEILKDHKGEVIFSCFGIWHILMMILIFGGIILTVYILGKRRSTQINAITIVIVIDIVFGLYILDFFLMPLSYGYIDIEKLPFHVCTASCVLCFLSNHTNFFKKFKQQFALIGLASNLIYVIYPAGVGWYQIAPYSYRVIQTLMFHGLMVLYGVLVLRFDVNKLSLKESYKELLVIMVMTIWAMIGNFIYNSPDRLYNWMFVVQDPFYMLPSNIAPFVMPLIIIATLYLAVILVYLLFILIRKFKYRSLDA